MKPYYEDEGNTIYCGDYREILANLASFELAICDSPYGQTSLAWDRWPNQWPTVIAERVASMWCFGTMRSFLQYADEFMDANWKLSQDIVWEKQNGSSFHADRFRRVHENVCHFYRNSWKSIYKSPVMTLDATKRTTRRKARPPHMGEIEGRIHISEDGGPRLQRSVIFEPSCNGYAENETQKPLGIIRPLIAYSCPLDGIVLDPFCGTGSTLVAAKEMGRKAVGIDIRESQCEIAARRLSQEVLEFV